MTVAEAERKVGTLVLFVIRKNSFIYVWSHFQVQGHIFGQVVTLYQI